MSALDATGLAGASLPPAVIDATGASPWLALLAAAGWALALAAAAVAVRLRRADRARAEHVARACHEVRGPLTAARLAVHAAGRERGDGRALRAVDRELARAGHLLADLTATPGAGRPAEGAGPVDVDVLLRRARDAWRPAARLRGRDVLVAAPGAGLRAHGDPRRLQQALSTLVGGAVEHGAGLVVLAARACAGVVRLEVADGGPGLPAPLGTVLASAPRAGGPSRGRGLAVTAEIAERHGGRLLEVRDEAGHRLVLELPLAGDEAVARAAAPPAAAPPDAAAPPAAAAPPRHGRPTRLAEDRP